MGLLVGEKIGARCEVSAVRAGTAISHRDQLPSASRYELLVKIASGGMATVYVGRLSAAVGITRLVAIKRAHAHLLENATFGRMLIAEAKLASRIHHPNVVAVQNVEEIEGELLLVMDYVEGASLSDLMMNSGARDIDEDDDHHGEASRVVAAKKDEQPLPARVVTRILLDACAGLHAAHELTDDDGKPLGIVHRDVSPHNILVGVDGVARLTDFGIAKSSVGGHTQSGGRTSTGALKGKVAYMAPEYVDSGRLDARSDVFALGIVAWEAFTRQRLFRGASEVESLRLVLGCEVPRPSSVAPWLGSALDGVVLKALARSPADRYASAAEFAEALESAARRDDLLAKHADVGAFVKSVANDALAQRRTLVRAKNPSAVAAAPSGIDAKPRDEKTATASIAAAHPRQEKTAPVVAAPASAPAAPPDATRPLLDAETFGSGVSAHLVSEARRSATDRPIASRSGGSRALLWSLGVLGILGAVGATAFFVRPPSSTAAARPETTTPGPSAPSTPLASAPPTSSVTTAASSSMAPSSSSVSSMASPIRHKPTAPPPTNTKPALPPPPAMKPTITPTFPTAEPDKAPPNPYGR